MTLTQMRYVAAVAKTGKISMAADQLFVTQPTLSGEIKKLEDELGIRIFERTRSGMVITGSGSELLSQILPVLDAVDQMKESFSGDQTEKIRFAVTGHHSSFISNAFIRLLNRHRDEPYEMKILECRTSLALNYVQTGSCDLAVLLMSQNNRVLRSEIDRCRLELHRICTVVPHVVLGAHHPLADRERLTLEELRPYPFMIFKQGKDSWSYFSEEIEGERMSRQTILLTDRGTQVNISEKTNAYTIGSGLLDGRLQDGSYVAIPLDTAEKIDIVWLRRQGQEMTPLMQEYLSLLEGEI